MRVEGLSKIIASILPASGRSAGDLALAPARLQGGAGVEDVRGARRRRSRRGRGSAAAARHAAAPSLRGAAARPRAPRRRGRAGRRPRAIVLVVMIERRQEAHDIVAGRDRRAAPRARAAAARSVFGTCSLEADHQPLAADLGDDGRMAVLQLGEALLQQQRRSAATCSRKPGASTTSSTALPTAMASGLPPKVVPCVPAVMPLRGLARSRGRRPSGSRRRCPWRPP